MRHDPEHITCQIKLKDRQTAKKNQKQQIHHPQIIVSQLSRQERQVHTHLDIRRLSQDSRNERDIKAKEGLLRCVSFKGQGNQCQGFDGEAGDG